MLLSEAFDCYKSEYLEFRVRAKRIFETHEQVKRTLIQELGDIEIEKVTMQDISAWYKKVKIGCCQNTSRTYITRIRMVLKHLELKGVECLKAELLPVPQRIDTIPAFLTAEEVTKMIDNTPRLRNKFVISLLYSSGIRLSELIQLNVGQIRSRRFTVVGKGGKARLCFIDKRTDELMKRYLASRNDHSCALVVSYRFGNRMTATNIQLLVRNAAHNAGLNSHITPHTLRHSFATNFLQNNGNLRYCQVLMGHARLETTAHYAHVTDRELEKQYEIFHTS